MWPRAAHHPPCRRPTPGWSLNSVRLSAKEPTIAYDVALLFKFSAYLARMPCLRDSASALRMSVLSQDGGDDSDGYGEAGLSWEAVMAAVRGSDAAEAAPGADADADADADVGLSPGGAPEPSGASFLEWDVCRGSLATVTAQAYIMVGRRSSPISTLFMRCRGGNDTTM